MPVFKGLTSTTIWKAFLLNALASSLIIVLAITIKQYFDVYIIKGNTPKDKDVVEHNTVWTGVFFSFLITFIATYLSFLLLHWLFGFGGGMLVTQTASTSN